jgi:hypothetical protein
MEYILNSSQSKYDLGMPDCPNLIINSALSEDKRRTFALYRKKCKKDLPLVLKLPKTELVKFSSLSEHLAME